MQGQWLVEPAADLVDGEEVPQVVLHGVDVRDRVLEDAGVVGAVVVVQVEVVGEEVQLLGVLEAEGAQQGVGEGGELGRDGQHAPAQLVELVVGPAAGAGACLGLAQFALVGAELGAEAILALPAFRSNYRIKILLVICPIYN